MPWKQNMRDRNPTIYEQNFTPAGSGQRTLAGQPILIILARWLRRRVLSRDPVVAHASPVVERADELQAALYGERMR